MYICSIISLICIRTFHSKILESPLKIPDFPVKNSMCTYIYEKELIYIRTSTKSVRMQYKKSNLHT